MRRVAAGSSIDPALYAQVESCRAGAVALRGLARHLWAEERKIRARLAGPAERSSDEEVADRSRVMELRQQAGDLVRRAGRLDDRAAEILAAARRRGLRPTPAASSTLQASTSVHTRDAGPARESADGLTRADLAARLDVPYHRVWRWTQDPRFPAPRGYRRAQVGPHAAVWDPAEVDGFVAALPPSQRTRTRTVGAATAVGAAP